MPGMMDRHGFTPSGTVGYIWTTLGLPEDALKYLHLPVDAKCCPSAFKVGHLAQASIGLSALSAALVWSVHNNRPVPRVTVPAEHACAEFKSERLYVLNGKDGPSSFGTIGGLHKTKDGHIRMHDGFPNHRDKALRLLGLDIGATRDEVAGRMLRWNSVDLETEAIKEGAVMAALRSFEEWDALPQAKAIANFPILLNKLAARRGYPPKERASVQSTRCLQGIRVVEMSRVIAAPVAGKTLAAHGAVSDHYFSS